MGKCNVIQIPKQLSRAAFPWLFVLDAQLINSYYFFGTLKAYIFFKSAKQMKKNNLAKSSRSRTRRHT